MRYVAAAAVCNAISASGTGLRLYRRLANATGGRRRAREGLPTAYLDRARRLLEDVTRFELVRDGDELLELGTGWVHWEATVVALFYDVQAVLVDVWDNRQLGAWRAYVRGLTPHIGRLAPTPERRDRAAERIAGLLALRSWSEIYDELRFTYDCDASGTLARFRGRAFALAASSNVLQHVPRKLLPGMATDLHRLLRPGGYAYHRIDLADQLSHFDRRAPRKNYLRFSSRAWRWIDSPLQHVNRLQLSEWLALFEERGLERVSVAPNRQPLDRIPVHPEFARFPRDELEVLDVRLLHRRPLPKGGAPADG